MNKIDFGYKKFFPTLEKVLPEKGENRLAFFKRQFKGCFNREEISIITKFIKNHGHQPMLPIWKKQGCYIVSATRAFYNLENRDKILNGLMIADLLYAYPNIELELMEKIEEGEKEK